MTKHWTVLLIGVWILTSPWLLGFADITLMKWSNLVCGTIIILISAWSIFNEKPKAPEQK